MGLLGRFKSAVSSQSDTDSESNTIKIDHGDEDAEEGDIRFTFEYDDFFEGWSLRKESYQVVAKGPEIVTYRWHPSSASMVFDDREDAIEFADWLSENARAMSEDTPKAVFEQ